MALRKPPAQVAHDEAAINPKALAFIQGAPDAKTEPRARGRRQQINLKFEEAFLEKIDDDVRKRGVNRTAWITFACSELLERSGTTQ